MLYFFGYTNHPTEENATAYFHFDNHKPAHLEKYYEFKRVNEKMKGLKVKIP